MALPFARFAALQRLDGPFQSNDLAGQQIFADKVFVCLPSGGLEEIHHCHGSLGPSQLPARFQPALTGYQAAFGRNYNRMKESDFGDAVG